MNPVAKCSKQLKQLAVREVSRITQSCHCLGKAEFFQLLSFQDCKKTAQK